MSTMYSQESMKKCFTSENISKYKKLLKIAFKDWDMEKKVIN